MTAYNQRALGHVHCMGEAHVQYVDAGVLRGSTSLRGYGKPAHISCCIALVVGVV